MAPTFFYFGKNWSKKTKEIIEGHEKIERFNKIERSSLTTLPKTDIKVCMQMMTKFIGLIQKMTFKTVRKNSEIQMWGKLRNYNYFKTSFAEDFSISVFVFS